MALASYLARAARPVRRSPRRRRRRHRPPPPPPPPETTAPPTTVDRHHDDDHHDHDDDRDRPPRRRPDGQGSRYSPPAPGRRGRRPRRRPPPAPPRASSSGQPMVAPRWRRADRTAVRGPGRGDPGPGGRSPRRATAAGSCAPTPTRDRAPGIRPPTTRTTAPTGRTRSCGPRAVQTVAPRSSRDWFQAQPSPAGTAASASAWTSPGRSGRPDQRASVRATLVSTTATSASKAKASIARAVYGPTPGRALQLGERPREAPRRSSSATTAAPRRAGGRPGGCSRGRSTAGARRRRAPPRTPAVVGNRSRNSRKRGTTRATWVCWSMVSDTRTAHGSRVRRHGRSRRRASPQCEQRAPGRARRTPGSAVSSRRPARRRAAGGPARARSATPSPCGGRSRPPARPG